MDIKSKSNDQFYLTCVLCEALQDFESMVKNDIELREKLLYNPIFQNLVSLRERITLLLLEQKNE